MAYHADFWVVVGTASPVIFLAAIVTSLDALSIRTPARVKRGTKRFRRWSSAIVVTSCLGMAAQGGAFLTALQSLANERDAVRPLAVIWIEAIGITFLLGSSGYLGGFRDGVAQRKEDEQRKATADT